jgi:hypothetical protein
VSDKPAPLPRNGDWGPWELLGDGPYLVRSRLNIADPDAEAHAAYQSAFAAFCDSLHTCHYSREESGKIAESIAARLATITPADREAYARNLRKANSCPPLPLPSPKLSSK